MRNNKNSGTELPSTIFYSISFDNRFHSFYCESLHLLCGGKRTCRAIQIQKSWQQPGTITGGFQISHQNIFTLVYGQHKFDRYPKKSLCVIMLSIRWNCTHRNHFNYTNSPSSNAGVTYSWAQKIFYKQICAVDKKDPIYQPHFIHRPSQCFMQPSGLGWYKTIRLIYRGCNR